MLEASDLLPSLIISTQSLDIPQLIQKPDECIKLLNKFTALKSYNLKWHPKR